MNDETKITVQVLAFGPLAEEIGWKSHNSTLSEPATVHSLIQTLALGKWKKNQLLYAVNGVRCEASMELREGDEVALLPPVSGG
jgi:molybdopterin converting factor small subunit|tara:strand:+ start:223 stop:474 length:252 start_codon:yes stop_codon:yes gene_type:complete